MSNARLYWVSAFLIYLTGAFNQGFSAKTATVGLFPDALFVMLCILSVMGQMRFALTIGFAAGIIQGAITGNLMWQFVLTRLLIGFLGGFLIESRFQRNYAVVGLATFLFTIICGVMMMIIGSQGSITEALKDTIIAAVYNGVLALLVYIPVERLTGVSKQTL
jgi:cell shape-determining protein MreD